MILHKSTLVDPMKSSQTWMKTNHISKVHALQHIKTNFPKYANSVNADDLGLKYGRHTER